MVPYQRPRPKLEGLNCEFVRALNFVGSEIPGALKNGRVLVLTLLNECSLPAIVPGILHRFTSFWPLFKVALTPILQIRNQGLAAALCMRSLANKHIFFPSLHNSPS